VIICLPKELSIFISDEDKIWLDRYAKVQRISLAEAVHRGICLLKRGERQGTYQKLVKSTYSIWGKGNGLAHQQKMRVEWGIDFA
jgi:hypothetical protein